MKLVSFRLQDQINTEPHIGVLKGKDRIVDVTAASKGKLPSDMCAFLDQGETAFQQARELAENAAATLALQDVKLLAPVPKPSKVIAIGLNYMDHCREQGHAPPTTPVIFTKFSTAIVGPGDEIRWSPALTQQVDYEAELAVVIGKAARRVPVDKAFDYVAGYTVCNDVSARDLQFSDGQWVRGKSLDTFCPLGPYLVTRDEVPDPQALAIRAILNGEAMQDSNTAEMIFTVDALIAFASNAFTLRPGDIIITGTPHGVGVFRDPQVFMHDGDTVTIEIEKIGKLTNTCVEEE